MSMWTGAADRVGLTSVNLTAGSPPLAALADARRRARMALIVMWGIFMLSLSVLPGEMVLAVAVLLAGLSTLLETTHGALAFDRLWRRMLRPVA